MNKISHVFSEKSNAKDINELLITLLKIIAREKDSH